MVERAVAELQVDLRKAYVVGDHAVDIQLARAVGARSVLVTSGKVDEPELTMLRAAGALPDMVAPSMAEAADRILRDAEARAPKVVAANAAEDA